MASRNRLVTLASTVALLAHLGTASATPMTYHVDLFNDPNQGALAGSGSFTIDTAGLTSPTACNAISQPLCFIDFNFTVGNDSFSTPGIGDHILFGFDAQGVLTGYFLELVKVDRDLKVTGSISSPGDGNTWILQSIGGVNGSSIVGSCDGRGPGCVVTTVPEPTTLSLLGLSLLGIGWRQRLRA